MSNKQPNKGLWTLYPFTQNVPLLKGSDDDGMDSFHYNYYYYYHNNYLLLG